MPTVELVSSVMPQLLPMEGRSPGIHVSEIIHNLYVRLKHYDPREEVNQAQFELGNAWEWAIIARHERHDPKRFLRLGELELDGLYGTPDLGDVVEDAIREFKATWLSVKWGPGSKKFWMYETQV